VADFEKPNRQDATASVTIVDMCRALKDDSEPETVDRVLEALDFPESELNTALKELRRRLDGWFPLAAGKGES
jgi:hypothetical protein